VEGSPNEKSELTRSDLEQLSRDQQVDLILLQQAHIQQLLQRVEDLERKLDMHSGNSNKPPSSDPPWNHSHRSGKTKAKRKRGGQPGHKGHYRELRPSSEADNIVVQKPTHCCRCHKKLHGEDPDPQRFQHYDLPMIKPILSELQNHSLECEHCGVVTTLPLPGDWPKHGISPRIQALIGALSGHLRLSKRLIQCMLEDVFHLPLSLGAICAAEKVVSRAVGQPVEEAHQHVQAASTLHADETSWWERNIKMWMWVAATQWVTIFIIDKSRGCDAARRLLGSFKGVLVADRWGGYNDFRGIRQACWAHLLRDFKGFSEYSGVAGLVGRELVGRTYKMFKWWHRVRDGTMSRKVFQKKMTSLQCEIEDLLLRGQNCGVAGVSGKCEKILKHPERLWRFVEIEGVEPTNNHAERALRPAVIWRKCSFGTQSVQGSRFVERVMTVVATCKQQRRNILEYLTQACEALHNGTAAPSLLPTCVHP
jgi:transposase